jgi:hypothetical protein
MSDRNLTVEVDYNEHGATAKVKQLDAAIEGVGTTVDQKATPALGGMSTMLKTAAGAAVTASTKLAHSYPNSCRCPRPLCA